jgi:hypothetical protein
MFDDDMAKQNANLYQRIHRTAARGAATVIMGYPCMAFGNDDYAGDTRSRREVQLLRQHVLAANIPILGFGLSDDSKTWLMILGTADGDLIRDLLGRAHDEAFGA